jgi:hypothetical protein
MNKEQVQGIVRHGLTFIGGILVSKGYIDESSLSEMIGALMTLSGIFWSIYLKKK